MYISMDLSFSLNAKAVAFLCEYISGHVWMGMRKKALRTVHKCTLTFGLCSFRECGQNRRAWGTPILDPPLSFCPHKNVNYW